jgi:drug/metabolite transporter (DMT)-like permease
MPVAPPLRYTALALFFSLLWASCFVVVKIALRFSPPLFLMASRFLVAGAALLVLALARGHALPRRRAEWTLIVVLGLLNYALYLGLNVVALQDISAGMGAVLASTNPLMLALAGPWVLGEPLTWRKVGGLLLAFGGVAAVMWSRLGDANRPRGMAVAVLAIMFLVVGTLVFKRVAPGQDLLVLNAVGLLAAGLALGMPSVVWEPLASVRFTPSFLAAQAYLIVAGSWIMMLIWFWLLTRGDATRASAYFFLNPVLGVFLGALFLGEPLSGRDFAGAVVVALGIYVVQRG